VAERDEFRKDRAKERQRERNIARAAPDKRWAPGHVVHKLQCVVFALPLSEQLSYTVILFAFFLLFTPHSHLFNSTVLAWWRNGSIPDWWWPLGCCFDSHPVHCQLTTLGKLLFTHVLPFTKQYNLVKGWWRSAAGNVTDGRSGVTLAMCHGLGGLSTYRIKGHRKRISQFELVGGTLLVVWHWKVV